MSSAVISKPGVDVAWGSVFTADTKSAASESGDPCGATGCVWAAITANPINTWNMNGNKSIRSRSVSLFQRSKHRSN